MTPEEKDLLLKDLCARLPYGLLVKTPDHYSPQVVNSISDNLEVIVQKNLGYSLLYEAKPYLRPMDSMTVKEKEELRDKNILIAISTSGAVETTIDGFDWLNKNMFDYRGLIEKGLALPAPEGMYNIMEGTFKEYADWMQNIGCATCIYVERLFSLWETKDKSKKFKFKFKCTRKNRIVTSNDGQIGRRCRGFIE